jgi:riboflavin kinase/FMN adenylyltransferase
VETHLLDGTFDLYGRTLRLAFIQWLREEVKFDSLNALRDQIAADCTLARELFDRMAL